MSAIELFPGKPVFYCSLAWPSAWDAQKAVICLNKY